MLYHAAHCLCTWHTFLCFVEGASLALGHASLPMPRAMLSGWTSGAWRPTYPGSVHTMCTGGHWPLPAHNRAGRPGAAVSVIPSPADRCAPAVRHQHHPSKQVDIGHGCALKADRARHVIAPSGAPPPLMMLRTFYMQESSDTISHCPARATRQQEPLPHPALLAPPQDLINYDAALMLLPARSSLPHIKLVGTARKACLHCAASLHGPGCLGRCSSKQNRGVQPQHFP